MQSCADFLVGFGRFTTPAPEREVYQGGECIWMDHIFFICFCFITYISDVILSICITFV